MNTFGDNNSYNNANLFNNMDAHANSSSDVRDAEKDNSMYSYSRVSQALKEDSFAMRQYRDQQLFRKSDPMKRNDSPSSVGQMARNDAQFKSTEDSAPSLMKQ